MVSRAYNLRGVVGDGLDEKVVKNFAKNIIKYIYSHRLDKMIIIGKDNRVSGDYILSVINSKLISNRIKVFNVGEVSTPELAFLTKKLNFPIGVMITASHNSWEYNGVKCFDINGKDINITDCKSVVADKKKFEKIVDIRKYQDLYLRELKNLIKYKQVKCIFDCANGSTLDVVRKIFPKQKIIGNDKTGRYINEGFGTQNLNELCSLCKRNRCIGFAFDGDGDRVIAVDVDGNVIDGDKILYILATQYLYRGDRVVGTVLSNLGLELSLRRYGIGFVREDVGAQKVGDRVDVEGILFGAEPCGHIYFSKLGRFDGVAIAILLLNILDRTGLSFNDLLADYIQYYQVSVNLPMESVKESDKICINYKCLCENSRGLRVVVRPSKTEPVLRVLVEADDLKNAENKMCEIAKMLRV